MFDADSLLVTYRTYRGDPRGPHKKGQSWEGRGDCIDCKACVAACPMGIDIRDGNQLECIQCALCIDACDDIMDKIGRPTGLIGYDTFRNLDAASHHDRAPVRLVRPRTVLYSSLIALVTGLMVWAWMSRAIITLNVIRDRNPLFVTLSDGGVRNGYTVKILNKNHKTHAFRISENGLDGATISIVGHDQPDATIAVDPDTLRALKVHVTVPAAAKTKLQGASTPFDFVVTDEDGGNAILRATTFRSAGE
jgi:cytochrome c oxidase accessory protein FixG